MQNVFALGNLPESSKARSSEIMKPQTNLRPADCAMRADGSVAAVSAADGAVKMRPKDSHGLFGNLGGFVLQKVS